MRGRRRASRCAWAALAYGDALATQWGSAARARRLLRRQGRPRGAAGAVRPCAARRRSILRCIRAAARDAVAGRRAHRCRRRVASALAAGLRAAARAGAVRAGAASALLQRELPSFAPIGRVTRPVLRDQASVVSERRQPRPAAARRCSMTRRGLVRRATLFDLYRPAVRG